VALNTKQEKILTEAKAKMKVMGQIAKLEKEISSLRKKLEMKESKVSELINILDEKNHLGKNSSVKGKAENGKSEDHSVLFTDS
jgi:predicted RNase H-like nuclease (RuvC/YqgF family)